MATGTLQVWLKILRWGDYPGFPGRPNAITEECWRVNFPFREGGPYSRGQKDKFEDATILVLNMELESVSQGIQAACKSWK